MLWSVAKSPELYRPVYKINENEWKRVDKEVAIT